MPLGCLLGGALVVLVLLLIGYGVCSYELTHLGSHWTALKLSC